MADFIINNAGAKIYTDINKHANLIIPILLNDGEKGVVHEVLSVGFLGKQREAIVTIRGLNGEAMAYRLPEDLYGWVENFMKLKLQGIDMFPAKVEFGKLDNIVFAEAL